MRWLGTKNSKTETTNSNRQSENYGDIIRSWRLRSKEDKAADLIRESRRLVNDIQRMAAELKVNVDALAEHASLEGDDNGQRGDGIVD